MGILNPMSFNIPQPLDYNPIAVAQARAQQEAQEAMRNGGFGNGQVAQPITPVGGAQGGSVTPAATPATAAGGSGGLLGSIRKVFGGGGDIGSIMKMLAMLG